MTSTGLHLPPSAADGDHSAYTLDILARIAKMRAALQAVKRLGRQSDDAAHGPFGALVDDMESYLSHLRKTRDREV